MIHDTAIIDDGVVMGKDVYVWHFSHVCRGASLGDGVSLGQNVYIGPHVSIGAKTRIQNNVFIPEGVTVGPNCFIGPGVVFTNDKYPPSPKEGWLPVMVHEWVSIGANATIIAGVTIGERARIGAGSVVTRSIPANSLVYGNPAKVSRLSGRAA